MEVLRAQWGKDKIELKDEIAELYKAVQRTLLLSGGEERHAIMGIQLMMSAEWSEISDRIVQNLNLNMANALHWYMAALAKAVYTPDKLRELSQKYEGMHLLPGEPVVDLIQRIAKAESALCALANKEQNEYDAKRCLVRCIERSEGSRREYLLQFCDMSDIQAMSYGELCELLVKKDRVRLTVQSAIGAQMAGDEAAQMGSPQPGRGKQLVNASRATTVTKERTLASGANAVNVETNAKSQQGAVGHVQCSFHPNGRRHTEDECEYLNRCRERNITPTMRQQSWNRPSNDRPQREGQGGQYNQQRTDAQGGRSVQLSGQFGQGSGSDQSGNVQTNVQRISEVSVTGRILEDEKLESVTGEMAHGEQGEGGHEQLNEQCSSRSGTLPYMDVILEGGVKARAWIDSLSSGCVINPNLVRLASSVRIEEARGFIHGANKSHPSTIVGVINPLVILLGTSTLVGQRVVVCNDTPVGLILGYDFIKQHLELTDHVNHRYMFRLTKEWVDGKEDQLESNVTLALAVKERVEWKAANSIHLLPGRTTLLIVRPTEPRLVTPAMVFEKAVFGERSERDKFLQGRLDVVTQLTWYNMETGEFNVPVVNISGFATVMEANTTVMWSDPVA